MMTEQEAKTKWCPFARTLETDRNNGYAASVNREPGDYDRQGNETVVLSGRHRCIASECMAWRWRVEATVSTGGYGPGASGAGPRMSDYSSEEIKSATEGYCGLAGKP